MSDEREPSTGVFLYAVVPSDVEPTPDAHGVGSAPVRAIRHDDLAALISEVRLDEPIGRPDDLTAYQRLLDETVTVAPVVPVRFGTVMTAEDGVEEWLSDQHGEIADALDEVDGRFQYTVHGRFDEQAFIGALLTQNAAAAELADRVRTSQSQQDRIQLGQMIAQAVELRQQTESRELVSAVSRYAVANAGLPPSHEMDAVHVAWLVPSDQEEAFVHAVEDFAEARRDLIHMRLLGPQAPYDFVARRPPG